MDTQRLILLMVFFFSMMMLWDAWQRHDQPVAGSIAMSPERAPSAGDVPAAPNFAASPAALPAAGTVAATEHPVQLTQKLAVRTDLVSAEISALGGDLVRLELLEHRATGKREENFVLLNPAHAYAAQSGLIGAGLPNHKTIWTLPAERLELRDGENELRVALEAPIESGGKVVKTYVFKRDSYLVEVEHAFIDAPVPADAHAYFQITRDDRPPEGSSRMMMTFTGAAVYTEQEKFMKVDFGDFGGKDKHPAQADNGWVAMVEHYFVTAWLPAGGLREYFTRKLDGGLHAVGVIVPFDGDRISVPLYAGPQEQKRLEAAAPGLVLVVDYGILTVISAPLFWVLEWIHGYVGNWGWAIILLTVLIKAIFFPLSAASYKSMAKMRVLTPKLMKLKETYGDNRQRMNQEMMDLYKKEKVNPLGGCLPIIVQIPVFIALYWVLLGAVEMRGAPWLGWIDDLSAMDPYFILPLLMGVSMFVQTRLNPMPPDPIQAKIMTWMPVAFTFLFLWFPSGLVLYWVVNNILSIAQQWQCNRMIEAGAGKKDN